MAWSAATSLARSATVGGVGVVVVVVSVVVVVAVVVALVVVVAGRELVVIGGWAWLVKRGNRKTMTPVVASASTATPATIGSSRALGALCRGGGVYCAGWGIVGGSGTGWRSGWDTGGGACCGYCGGCCCCCCCATGVPHDPQNRA